MGATRTYLSGLMILCIGLSLYSSQASADSEQERKARELLAQKLLKLSQSLDMKEATFPESKGGGKDYNANDGNSFTSNTTYHSYVWDYCMQWIGGRYCRKWLDPYTSPHAFTADQSPLEGLVGAEWKRLKKDDDPGQDGQYAIWKVEKQNGGSIIDVDGKLDRQGLTKWELLPDVRKKVENVGEQTAVRQISLTYDDSTGKGENTMPNMEGLRLMAERWTKMYRNRMVANLGELRAASRGVEFALGEDKPNCQAYVQSMEREMEETRTEERIQPQALLDPETRAKTLQERYQACVKLRAAPVSAINPMIQGNDVQSGPAETEQYDKWAARVTIATIDSVGLNPNSLPKPAGVNLTKDQYSSELVDYASGGINSTRIRATNAEQLQGYNDNLERAAVGMQEVTARTGGYLVDNSDQIRKFKIAPQTVNAVQLNGLTPEMRGELAGTGFPRTSPQPAASEPSQSLEQKPSEIVVTKTQ